MVEVDTILIGTFFIILVIVVVFIAFIVVVVDVVAFICFEHYCFFYRTTFTSNWEPV